jgi:DNA-binding NarL/FixJ family response regulator
MDFGIYVLSLHPLAGPVLIRYLAADAGLRRGLHPKPYSKLNSVPQDSSLCVFLLDTSSLAEDVPVLCKALRARCPNGKFLALLSPDRSRDEDMVRMLYAGIDGFVTLTDKVEEELTKAVRSVLEGSLWVPPQVIRKYIRHSNFMLEKQLHPDLPLTARQNQVFQLVVRRLSNKEIAETLKISERTAKFHLSNIFLKLGVNSRTALIETVDTATHVLAVT